MDEIGRRYQALALRIDRHLPGYVDFWTGPDELREAISAEALCPPIELHVEAIALHEMASALPAATAAEERRRAWLSAQLTAMSATCRRLSGEEIAYADLVEVLFDVPAAMTPEADVEHAHALLDDALPPGPDLRGRLAAHDAATAVPASAVVPAIADLADRLRERTLEDLSLPDGEGIELVEVHDQPWAAYATYVGDFRTRIEINVDLPMTLFRIVQLASHEAYPGHHAERATKDLVLVRDAGFGEAALACDLTPEWSVTEGLGEICRGIVMADAELAVALKDLVQRLHLPIRPADAEREVAVGWGRALLSDLWTDAGLLMHQHGLPESEVRSMLEDRGLRYGERLDRELRIVRDPATGIGAFAYATGRRLIEPWLATQGQTAGFARLLREQLSPGQLRAELGDSRALYPGSLV